ncbi:aldehyde oxidase GLOX-like isoform X2 [Durio zibethinus]|uniref:Aldehyde oxidase GLOX-like isoform X2 n=1 Tax=Durio zibethinus TaxID=66656 RepID=A0A6P5WU93_DURZI|nr:aldehyde oxidase GLOX-like isoform X2 [Durio zibethinus]
METKKLTAESTPIFQEGIGLILSRWSALTAAVENEWGGRDSRVKANILCSDLISFFTKPKVEPLYIDDLENILEEGLLSLNTLVEDGSIEEFTEEDEDEDDEDESMDANNATTMMVDVSNSKASSNTVGMQTDEPKPNQAAAAEDGWVVVSSRRNKVLPSGTLVQTGGYNDGDRHIRFFTPCIDENCDWIEFPQALIQRRWYATNQILPDGRIIIVGGRRQFNYEFYPQNLEGGSSGSTTTFWLNFLRETNDHGMENNLYPFLHLLPDGNLFIFANTQSILLDYNQNRVVKQFPSIPGDDPRNYPSSGSSVLLPLDENKAIEPEIMVCGGAPRGSFTQAMQGNFIRAISTCGRLKVSHATPSWTMEDMPVARVMGDMILLPTGDVLIINGAELGTAGWELGRGPVTRPIIYRPSDNPPDWRFSVMSPSSRPRMYHSSAILLTDGRILVSGSNPHIYYNFTNVEYPTDLSMESFSPSYLSQEYDPIRPQILSLDEKIGYGGKYFWLSFKVHEYLTANALSVRIVAPSFTTHSFSMNQRMVSLKIVGVTNVEPSTYGLTVAGPSTAEIAPPGYYLLFLVHANIPSYGMWVKIE